MSSVGGSTVGGDGVLEKRGPDHPKGSGKKIKVPEMMPPASQKCGRPKGSCNQETMAALEAVATAAPTTTAAAGVALALGGEGVPKKRGPGHPRGSGRKTAPTTAAAPSSPCRRGRPTGSKTKEPLLPSRPLPPAPRGPARQPLPQLVRHDSGRRNRHSSHRPISRLRGDPPA
jgi:hypothetical protein